MREIAAELIRDHVARLVQETNYYLGKDVLRALKKAEKQEVSPIGREVLGQIIENVHIASSERVAICQDTGVAVVFLEMGGDLHIRGNLEEAINEGVRRGYQEGYLRNSMVKSPLNRINTGDNTPAVIHLRIVPGDRLKIIVAPKGAGSENMSTVKMLKPSDGLKGIKEFVIRTVDQAGANPCPPVIVGIGLGGTLEKAALLAKQALLRPIDDHHSDPDIARLEGELLEDINKLGIGPQGLGGSTTALAVKIEIFPCHIASFPVAVNLNCHVARHGEVII
jgi:fumarate hydratase subunit alpha